MGENKVTVTVEVGIKTKIRFWDAIKLRLAGGKYIEEYIKNTFLIDRDVNYGR